MFKDSTVLRQLYIALCLVVCAQTAGADAALVQVTALQKSKIEELVKARFGADIRNVTYTMFSYDQAGWDVFANVLPGVSSHGVTFLMKNGTPVRCAWSDSSKARVIVLKRCEIKTNSKISY